MPSPLIIGGGNVVQQKPPSKAWISKSLMQDEGTPQNIIIEFAAARGSPSTLSVENAFEAKTTIQQRIAETPPQQREMLSASYPQS